MSVYENMKKFRGPYLGKDNRLRSIIELNDGTKIFKSYPKYLMEKHWDRYLSKDETVDHIDGNPLNNDISNLRVISRREHASRDAVRNEDVEAICAYCGKKFIIPGNKLSNRNRSDGKRKQTGYFCSKQCAGKYGAEVQNGRRKPNEPVERLKAKKYSLHDTKFECSDGKPQSRTSLNGED